MQFLFPKPSMPRPDQVLPGRSEAIVEPRPHVVNGHSLTPPYPEGFEVADFGMGCFWGAEQEFWSIPGVWVTAVGYQGGTTPNPTYRESCTGKTGHAEVVRVVYDPAAVSYERLLKTFWESHDPTQGYRQGNDVGTEYRSAIFTHSPAQLSAATASRDMYAGELAKQGYGEITTEIREAPAFYFAEDYHQQYLAKNPGGYCPNHATGAKLPDAFVVTPLQLVD
jgi:peptide-methionine (S)-S-oxide reductase